MRESPKRDRPAGLDEKHQNQALRRNNIRAATRSYKEKKNANIRKNRKPANSHAKPLISG